MKSLCSLKNGLWQTYKSLCQLHCCRWAVDISAWSPTLAQLEHAIASIQPEERIRISRFCFLEDALCSLIGRLLMRKFVHNYTNIPYSQVRFARDVRGKPYLDVEASNIDVRVHPKINFNISHQGDFIVLVGVAVPPSHEQRDSAEECGVGIDVMKFQYSGGKSLTEFLRLLQRKFSNDEWHFINQKNFDESAKLKAFMRIWCLKESFVKELGVGITIDLQTISFIIKENIDKEHLPVTSTCLYLNNAPMNNWIFEEHLLNDDYCVAIAFKNCHPTVNNFQMLTTSEIIVVDEKPIEPSITNYCRNIISKSRKK